MSGVCAACGRVPDLGNPVALSSLLLLRTCTSRAGPAQFLQVPQGPTPCTFRPYHCLNA